MHFRNRNKPRALLEGEDEAQPESERQRDKPLQRMAPQWGRVAVYLAAGLYSATALARSRVSSQPAQIACSLASWASALSFWFVFR